MTTLSVAFGAYPHIAPLRDSSVTPEGFDLSFATLQGTINQAFRRMVRASEYDVSEMALMTYLSAKEHHKPFTALAVFPAREVPHRVIAVNTAAGIAEPKDLEGRSIGVRSYTGTTATWARGVLFDQYGVDLDAIHFVVADDDHVAEWALPPNVELRRGTDLTAMLADGELAAGIGLTRPDTPNVAPLIADQAAKVHEWADRGIVPINHTVVVRDEVLAQPGAAEALYDAFVAAKQPLLDRLAADGPLADEERAIAQRGASLGTDPIPYGIERNRASLEALIGFGRAQHIISTPFALEEIFVGSRGE